MSNESDELPREAQAAGARVDAYLDTISRMERDIAMVDHDAAMASIAISLKRIADALDSPLIADRLSDAIYNAVTQAALGIQRRG